MRGFLACPTSWFLKGSITTDVITLSEEVHVKLSSLLVKCQLLLWNGWLQNSRKQPSWKSTSTRSIGSLEILLWVDTDGRPQSFLSRRSTFKDKLQSKIIWYDWLYHSQTTGETDIAYCQRMHKCSILKINVWTWRAYTHSHVAFQASEDFMEMVHVALLNWGLTSSHTQPVTALL